MAACSGGGLGDDGLCTAGLLDSYTWILPDGEEYVPYTNLHCVVLTGEEYGQYRVADPINGWQTVEKETFWSSFDAVGRRAVTIAGNEEALA